MKLSSLSLLETIRDFIYPLFSSKYYDSSLIKNNKAGGALPWALNKQDVQNFWK